jgi:hypothetical protein
MALRITMLIIAHLSLIATERYRTQRWDTRPPFSPASFGFLG